MPGIGQGDSPRFSPERRRGGTPRLSPLRKDGSPRRSFSYLKLPEQLLKITVLKLDGSCFDVQVARMASVAELKQAVEDVFNPLLREGQGKISWSHLWGHFCLSYEGQKLFNDRAYIRDFGINDGDQLHFIRHRSVNYNPVKKRSKAGNAACKQQTTFSSGLNALEGKEQNGKDDDDGDGQENDQYDRYEDDSENEDLVRNRKFKLAHFLKRWFMCSSSSFRGRRRSQGRTQSSRFAGHRLRVGMKATLH